MLNCFRDLGRLIFKFDTESHSMWKFQDFSVDQILREINFGESKSSKTAVFAILGALNF